MEQSSKRITTLVIGLFMAFGLTFSSCKKAETGPAGKDGNANVQSTGEVDLSSLWIYNSGDDFYKATVTTSLITQEIADNGLVMAYVKQSGGWIAIPISSLVTDGDRLAYEIENGAVNLYYEDLNGATTTYDIISVGLKVRLVIIPAQLKKPAIDYSNYLEVKEAYNL